MICISLFMTKDNTLIEYDRSEVDKQRAEYLNQERKDYAPAGKGKIDWDKVMLEAEAIKKYPYRENKAATNILGFKVIGEHYKFKYSIIFSLLILGSLLIFTLADKKK